jgi:hypothetical protein
MMLCCALLMLLLVGSAAQAYAAPSEAEYKKLAKTFVLHADGSQEMRYQMELTLYTHTAMRSAYGESFVVYDPAFQELVVNASYTKQRDGRIINTPANAFVPVLPRAAADAPAYNRLQEMVIVHTGLELGATIYLDYTLKSKPGYLGGLDVCEELLQSSPVKEYDITVAAPEGRPLLYDLTNNATRASETVADGVRTLSWQFRDLPALSRDALVSAAAGDLPVLCATSYASTAEALEVLNAQMDQGSDPQLASLASSLTEGAATAADKVERIMKYVTRLDDNRLSLEQTGYRFRPASAVVATAYGTNLEKANLLAVLLRCAGLKAEPMAGYKVADNRALGLKAIDQVMVACEADGSTWYLSPSSLYPSPLLLTSGITALKTISGGADASVASPDGKLTYTATITFEQGKPSAHAVEVTPAILTPYFASQQTDHTNALPFKTEGGCAVLLLPESSRGVSVMNGLARPNSARDNNLLIPRLVDEEQDYTTILPEGASVSNKPVSKRVANAAGTYSMELTKDGSEVRLKRSLKLNKQLYTPQEYQAVRELLINWNDSADRRLIINMR